MTPGAECEPSGAVAAGGEVELRGRVLTAAGLLSDAVVAVRGARIAAVTPVSEWVAAQGRMPPRSLGTILPGLVDIHNHGGHGHRFDTTDPAEAAAAAAFHHRAGTTTLLASIVTAAPDDLVAQVTALRDLVTDGTLAGIHIEGPFLSEKRCGAHDPGLLLHPDPHLIDRLLKAADGALRVMTLAPELPGFAAAAKLLTDNDVVVALGHSDAAYPAFRTALPPAGPATLITHLANGMRPLHHRDPGPIAAALVAAAAHQATIELIGDGVHLDPGFAALAFATAPRRVALITDAMQAAGMPDGTYRLGSQTVHVENGTARVPSGSIAGGTATLLQCLRWAATHCAVPLIDAVAAATATPAAATVLPDVGDLRPGMYADALIVDDNLRPLRVLRRGRWIV
ncbi:N-acetylglucosamine-6-phosphate deacetylase [Nocardia inohanensis]|uniref:N-acetylglucosamine-6-phosphate deacetylase n=1 Tax=Nocardia inohanensis TaxID=209246 RepID=UPI000831BB4A|nr:amidohydrolase family protein [Nocardia inohanensis]